MIYVLESIKGICALEEVTLEGDVCSVTRKAVKTLRVCRAALISCPFVFLSGIPLPVSPYKKRRL